MDYHQKLIDYFSAKIKLSEADQAVIRDCFEVTQLQRKEHLFEAGNICDRLAFVIEGTLRIYYIDSKGLEHVLYFGFPNWWASDIASFSTKESGMLSAQAMEKSIVLEVSPAKNKELLEKIPALERFFRILAERHLVVLQKRFLLTISANASERYLELLERSPGIEQLVPQHQIASYLGILPESLSRMKKQLLK